MGFSVLFSPFRLFFSFLVVFVFVSSNSLNNNNNNNKINTIFIRADYVQPSIINIGMLGAISSNIPTEVVNGYTADFTSSIQLGFDQVNAMNFVPGTTFDLSVYDIIDQRPDLAVRGALDMMFMNQTDIILGPQGIVPTRAVAGMASAVGVPNIGFQPDDDMSNHLVYSTHTRMQPSTSYVYKVTLRVFKALGWKKITVIDTTNQIFPIQFYNEAAKLNLTTTTVTYTSNSGNVDSVVRGVKASRSKILYLNAITSADAAAILNALYAAELNAENGYVWFGGRFESQYIQAANKNYRLMGVAAGVNPNLPNFQSFYSLYQETANNTRYPRRASGAQGLQNALFVAGGGYDTAFVVALVVKDLIARELPLNGSTFGDALTRIDFVGASGRVRFDVPNNDREMTLQFRTLTPLNNGSSFHIDFIADVYTSDTSVTFHAYTGFTWPNGNNCSLAQINQTFSYYTATLAAGTPIDYSCLNPCVHGTCTGMDTCTCTDPLLWAGPLCDTKKYIELTDPAGIAVVTIAITFSFLAFLVLIVLLLHKHNPAVRKSSALFCSLMATGFIMGYLSMITYVGRPSSSTCLAQLWVPTMTFAIVFANLLAKTWRINLIFNNTKLKTLALYDSDLLRFSGIIIAIEVIILIIWSIGAPPGAIETALSDGTLVTACGNNEKYIFQRAMMGTLMAFNLFLILFAVFLAYRTRKANYSYRESRFIAYAVYNILFCSVIFFALLLRLEIGTPLVFALKQLCTFIMVTFTLGVLLVPKVILVLRYTPEQQTAMLESKERKHGNGSGEQHSSSSKGRNTVANVVKSEIGLEKVES